MRKRYWVSCSWATGEVQTEDNVIVFAPPVWQRFQGQTLERLLSWLRKSGLADCKEF